MIYMYLISFGFTISNFALINNEVAQIQTQKSSRKNAPPAPLHLPHNKKNKTLHPISPLHPPAKKKKTWSAMHTSLRDIEQLLNKTKRRSQVRHVCSPKARTCGTSNCHWIKAFNLSEIGGFIAGLKETNGLI